MGVVKGGRGKATRTRTRTHLDELVAVRLEVLLHGLVWVFERECACVCVSPPAFDRCCREQHTGSPPLHRRSHTELTDLASLPASWRRTPRPPSCSPPWCTRVSMPPPPLPLPLPVVRKVRVWSVDKGRACVHTSKTDRSRSLASPERKERAPPTHAWPAAPRACSICDRPTDSICGGVEAIAGTQQCGGVAGVVGVMEKSKEARVGGGGARRSNDAEEKRKEAETRACCSSPPRCT